MNVLFLYAVISQLLQLPEQDIKYHKIQNLCGCCYFFPSFVGGMRRTSVVELVGNYILA